METNSAGRAVLQRCGAGWSEIFTDLARLSESERLRILRPHAELGFFSTTNGDDMVLRSRLDAGLENLALLELASGTGCLNPDDLAAVAAVSPFEELFPTSSFRRFADFYLYFGVRFLAGRLGKPGEVGCEVDLECNTVPLALKTAPAPRGSGSEFAESALLRYMQLKDAEAVEGPVRTALAFLDDFVVSASEKADFELWLRGLWHGPSDRFTVLQQGFLTWIRSRAEFYRSLENTRHTLRPGWMARNPLTPRFGLNDLYWLARLLRAEVSSTGLVRYSHKSWLDLIAAHADFHADKPTADFVRDTERLLRGVLDYACDLIQNASEVTEAKPRKNGNDDSRHTAGWRETFDEELAEIGRQREERNFAAEHVEFGSGLRDENGQWWSRRIVTGDYAHDDVIGLAFSGGGIRSATLGLGVLEGLQELDLLRYVDYLSTVSGGGYIGSWLLGNVLRTSHWLGQQTSWDASIGHLRRYGKYLAPHSGLLSADLWTMWGIWLRNAVLVQLTAVIWLVFGLATCLLGMPLLNWVGKDHHLPILGYTGEETALGITIAVVIYIAIALGKNLRHTQIQADQNCFNEKKVQGLLVVPAWISAFFGSALLWAQATGRSVHSPLFADVTTYSAILARAIGPMTPVLIAMSIGYIGLAVTTMKRERGLALLFGPFSAGVFYLQVCAVEWLFRGWASNADRFAWYAMVLGPWMMLLSATISVVVFIGLCGRSSSENSREWWTRMGSWMAMYGVGYLILSVAAVIGPWWILRLMDVHWGARLSAAGGLLGTIISGLLAGKSDKSSGSEGDSKLNILAHVGAILFIVSGLLSVSTLLHLFLVNAGTDLTPSATFYWMNMAQVDVAWTFWTAVVALLLGLLFSWRVELNIFSLNHFYRNRLVRCYLGATRWRPGMRKPNPFTGFDDRDDIPLNDLRIGGHQPCQRPFRGPFPLVNCTLNLGGSDDLNIATRQSASFTLTPIRCGSDRERVGYAPTSEYAGGVKLGQAVSISGAAASPNMGYSTSPLVSFLLTMFNVRLGWWFPNPSGRWVWRRNRLPAGGVYFLIKELFGLADEKSWFLNVSDGGHFENLGIYELVRRRVRVIIASDGECDEELQFGSLGNLVRICETDFGAKIDIDVSSIRKQADGTSRAHCAVGRILYSNGSRGWLIYMKSSLTGNEDIGVAQYKATHPTFPHESTADQFFSEDQFESYRRLGKHIVHDTFHGTQVGELLTAAGERLYDMWTPASFSPDAFLKHTKTLDEIWERFRSTEDLDQLLREITSNSSVGEPEAVTVSEAELCACLELTQLMENVFIDLRLDDFWTHPDNRGWAMLFSGWARSPIFRAAWKRMRRTYGIRFEYFCEERLGLEKERPVARV